MQPRPELTSCIGLDSHACVHCMSIACTDVLQGKPASLSVSEEVAAVGKSLTHGPLTAEEVGARSTVEFAATPGSGVSWVCHRYWLNVQQCHSMSCEIANKLYCVQQKATVLYLHGCCDDTIRVATPH